MGCAPLIASHTLQFTPDGRLAAWGPWRAILARVMAFYRQCPRDYGYPRFACETFLDADWRPNPARSDLIPAMQNGTGILSYLAWRRFAGDPGGGYLEIARQFGRYLVQESLTPAEGAWPRFTRSTGRRGFFPQPADCGAQSDRPHEIEPDKGGIAGYALLRLWEADGSAIFLAQALQNARLLASHQRRGDDSRSPWPFRVDYRDGTPRGEISGNMSYILRLYERLLAHGYAEFGAAREALWRWIRDFQLPSLAADGALFAQFFEDHDTPANRSAWAPLSLARYLLDADSSLGVDRLALARTLIDFTERNFTHLEHGVRVCHEQDEDQQAWNGVNSTYGAILARYARAAGSAEHAQRAADALNFSLYCVDGLGRPRDVAANPAPGGWQEDAHTDVIHNIVDALTAFPEWAGSP